MLPIKLVVTGDGAAEHLSMLITFFTGAFPGEYPSRLQDSFSANMVAPDGTDINLGMHDMVSDEEYDRLRPHFYPGTDVHVVCFSIMSPASFANAETKWFPELEQHSKGVPVVLVGTKLDLRSHAPTLALLKNKGLAPISSEQGAELAQKLGAAAYRECSALTQEGLKGVFETAVQAAQTYNNEQATRAAIIKANKRGKCLVM